MTKKELIAEVTSWINENVPDDTDPVELDEVGDDLRAHLETLSEEDSKD